VVRRLLLLSNSSVPGMGLLQHALDAVEEIMDGRRSLLFVAFASSRPDLFTRAMGEALAAIGVRVHPAHPAPDVAGAIAEAEAVFVGGGNSFRLVRALSKLDALDALRSAVHGGTPYLGASAGSNLACPTIRTTNDMPIVEPGSLNGVGLVPFQINAHYVDPDPLSPLGMETRPQRIEQFLEENDVPVLGMREGSWIRVNDDTAALWGVNTARLFRRGTEAVEVPAGSDLSWLLATRPRFDVGQD
jgi:dipeptidase E